MPKTIALYGDSHIQYLRRFCDGDLRVPGDVFWYGNDYLRTDFLNRHGDADDLALYLFEDLKDLRPDVVFINVGGDDLSTKTQPRDIYDKLVGLVHQLQQEGVEHIFVAEIMTRGDFSTCSDPEMNKTSFDRQRKKINHLLAKTFKDKMVRFADVRHPSDYSADLVNLVPYSFTTKNTGMKKYESRIRRILCSIKH